MDPNNQQMPPANPGQAPMTPPSTPPSAQFGVAPVTAPAGGGKKKMLLWVIIAALIVVAGVAYGVYAYISNTPENLIKSAVQNMSREKSLAATLNIMSGTGSDKVTLNGDLAFKADPNNGKNGEAIVGIGTDSTRVSLSALSLDGTLYLKLAHAENLGELLSSFAGSESAALDSSEFAAALENVNDKWFEITKDQVQAIAESSGNANVAASPTPEDLKKTLEIYNQHSFVKPDKIYADEVVDGSNSAHFSVKVDKNEEVAFLQALKAANLATIKVTDDDINQVKDATETTDTTLDLWISRDGHKFKQLRVVGTKPGEEVTMTVTLKSQLPTFDPLEKPSSTRPFSDFYTILLGGSL
jgi:hypothetical protein